MTGLGPRVPRTTTPGRIIAHRGASRIAPENTLAAFRQAHAQGARWIEFDVALLGDETPVVHHDGTFGRTASGTGKLADARRADLAGIDAGGWFSSGFAGERLPELDQALDLLDELGMSANLEMKVHGEEGAALARVVAGTLAGREWTTGRVIVSSFDHRALGAFRQEAPAQPLALLWTAPPRDWVQRVQALQGAAAHLDWRRLRLPMLAEAAAHDIELRVYTNNEPNRLVRFRDGLTGVITDHPPLFLDRPDWARWAAADRPG